MKKKRINDGNVEISNDGGKTWTVLRAATPGDTKASGSAVKGASSKDGITAYKGDISLRNTSKSNASIYSDKDWQEFRDKYYPTAKNNKELQKMMREDTTHPEFEEEVKRLHEYYGPLKGDQNWNDARLGYRWDAFLAKAKGKKPETPAVLPTAVKPETPVIDKAPQAAAPAEYMQQNPNAPWWLQDVVNTAAAAGNRFGLKKYLPWAPNVQLQTPRPTFYDPTRELAANAEAMAIGTEGAGMFAGPQAFNSRFSGIQGQGAKNAANILANYHNKNVGTANQFENLRTDILNKNNMLNADSARKLYDQTTVANQQFDNAKRQANNEIRESYVNALTNRAMTQTMNTLYPHYQVDPMRGGYLNFTKGTTPRPSATESLSEQIAEAKKIAAENNLDFKDVLDYMGKGRSQDRRRDSMPEYDDPSNLSAEELERQDWLRQRGITNIGPYGGYTR